MILSPRFLFVVLIYSHLFFVITIIRQIESFVLLSSSSSIPSSSSSYINALKMMEYNEDYYGGHEYNIHTIKPEETLPLREKVMWPGRPEMCKLKDDSNGIHLGLYYCSDSTQEQQEKEEELLVGVISIFINQKLRTAQFRKFAIDQNQQGKGIGSILLETAIKNMKRYTIDDNDNGNGNDHDDCDDHQEERINNDESNKNKKLKIFYCDARTNQESFYEKPWIFSCRRTFY
jgi:GNAT superfamily N-acetyltransferase